MVEPLDTKAWVLVPVEPTEEMVSKGYQNCIGSGNIKAVYAAMLSASPSLPVVDGAEVVATSWKYHDRACVDFKFSPDPYALERGFLTDIQPLVRQSALIAAESRVQSLEEEVKRLREALEPFADFGEFMEVETEGFSDTDRLELVPEESDVRIGDLFVSAFRRARSALSYIDTQEGKDG